MNGGRGGALPLAAASYQEMAEMRGGEGLPEAAGSCQELAEMRGGEGLPEDSASCQEMAKIEGEKRLPYAPKRPHPCLIFAHRAHTPNSSILMNISSDLTV